MKILFIKLSSIGDLVHTLPAYHALEKKLRSVYPQLEIDWLVYDKLAPILEKSIDSKRLIRVKRDFIALMQKALELKGEYDHVLDLQGLLKTALMSKIIQTKSNYGFKKPREKLASSFYKDSFCDYESLYAKKHVVDQNMELVSSFYQYLTKHVYEFEEINFKIPYHEAYSNNKKKLCLIPATTWESKHWSIKNWTRLLASIKDADKEGNIEFFMTGSSADQDYLQNIAMSSVRKIEIITDKKLPELYEFYQKMDIVIGVDTGPLHIAAAANYDKRDSKTIIGLYGPSSGLRSQPYGFDYVSVDELTGKKASNKKTSEADDYSIEKLTPGMVLAKLSLGSELKV